MSLKGAIGLAAAIFALTVLARLPANALTRLLPASVQCDSAEGTVWEGSCSELRSDALALADVHWTLQPTALLLARLRGELRSTDPRAAGQTQWTLHASGLLELEHLEARLPLNNGLGLAPQGWSGVLELAIDRASLRDGRLRALQGRITLRQLRSERPPADLGSYQLDVPAAQGPATDPGEPIVGRLRDIGGPLALEGLLRLSDQGAYELSGTVTPRSGASDDLRQALQLLGTPDAQGRYTLTLSGTM